VLNGLDLFSGIGGLTLALAPWVRPVAYCENDRYAQSVLLSKMGSGELPSAPIWDDVTTMRGDALRNIDIVYGGFPCQDVSLAGARKGLDGERTGLFREAIRLIRECKPQFVFFENVPGIRRYVPSVRGELEALGYDCRDGFLSAAEVGANHIRNRWWLLAHANGRRTHAKQELAQECKSEAKPSRDGTKEPLADSTSERLEKGLRLNGGISEGARPTGKPMSGCDDWYSREWWGTEPQLARVVDGIPHRAHRIKGLGNAVVPAQAREAFKRLVGLT
jgi:DNA (cytosine-5)-methyltransferase 1